MVVEHTIGFWYSSRMRQVPVGPAPHRGPEPEADAARRSAVRAWCLYDWANSAFATSVIAAILPPFFAAVAGRELPGHLATAARGNARPAALLVAAVTGPVLGAAADHLGRKKPLLFACVAVGAAATALLGLVPWGGWHALLVLFAIAFVAFAAGNVLYDALLPGVAAPGEMDRVSSRGFAYGYVGGGLLLAVNLAWILKPRAFGLADADAATRLSFVSVALWWLLFSIPLFRRVPEAPGARDAGPRADTGDAGAPADAGDAGLRAEAGGAGGAAAPAGAEHAGPPASLPAAVARRLARTIAGVRRQPELFRFLIAFWLYSDGIGTIIKMAAIYGAEIGIGRADLIGALLLVQILAAPASLAFGRIAGRLGARPAILAGLAGYLGITLFAFFLTRPWHFWALAALVAMFQGGTQALSRSLFATLVPRARVGELFGFYSVSEKLAGVVGPLLFGLVAQASGAGRLGVLTLLPFFLGGGWLLATVDLERGARRAREG
ncbi:MAG: MFS transporter [Candidatus Eisenbacteria bacterium]|nr:MFS transporter [Candidatus Eisenbacteria bacterium]